MKSLPRIFTARQVLTITGVPYSQVNSWIKTGIIRPSISIANGSGSRCLYSHEDLVAIRAAWNLRKSGLGGKALKAGVDYISKNFGGFAAIKKVGKDVILRSGHRSVSILRKPGQMYLDLTPDIGEAVVYVHQQLDNLSDPAVQKKPITMEVESERRSRRRASQ